MVNMIHEKKDKMKQYRITTQYILPKEDNDCVLSADDPVYELMASSQLGGLGGQESLQRYNARILPDIKPSNKGQIQRENNIKPGTDEWFRLWFTKDT